MTAAATTWLRAPASSLLVAGGAGAIGYYLIVQPRLAVILCLLPLAALLATRPPWLVAVGIGCLPVLRPFAGAEGSAAVVSASDAAFLVAAVGLVPLLLLHEGWQARLTLLKRPLFWAAPFLGWMIVLLAAHASTRTAFKTLTAAEVTVLPMVLAVLTLDKKHVKVAVDLFLVLAAALALIWTLRLGNAFGFAGNKNYAGQFLADAIVLTLATSRRGSRRLSVLPLYVAGLLFSASRGSLVGAAIGCVVLLLVRGLGTWKRTAAAGIALVGVVVGAYVAVPTDIQARVGSIFSNTEASDEAGDPKTGLQKSLEYNVELRKVYREDGLNLIREHPFVGVGLGNYVTGFAETTTVDPHNVLIRTAADGGIPYLLLFGVFVVGTGLAVFSRLNKSPWAGAALALQASLLTHGMVDVYWVRGTPVIGWVVVGLALNSKLDRDAA